MYMAQRPESHPLSGDEVCVAQEAEWLDIRLERAAKVQGQRLGPQDKGSDSILQTSEGFQQQPDWSPGFLFKSTAILLGKC